jgi:hypothetical protein
MRKGPSPLGLLFGCTLFVSAALIFFVQPMFAKMVLPRLGGSPSVWNTCVVFFQAALLAGYGYAHLLTTRFTLRGQVIVHLLVLGLAALALPIAIPAGWLPPTDSTPVPWLLTVLAVGVGGPFVVASASAPLFQRWFSLAGQKASADPYFLYTTSNLGSLASLLAYPLLVEPVWTLSEQSWAWTIGFVVLAVMTLGCGIATQRSGGAAVPAAPAALVHTDGGRDAVTWRRRAHWLALSAVPSSLMLSVTTYLSTDIAAVPLLWVLPLMCYLLSFVIAFAPRPIVPSGLAARVAPLLVCVLVLLMFRNVTNTLAFAIPLHLLTFLAFAVALHLELVDRRPGADRLTEFYLWLALGGVIGGSFNAFVAPALFTAVTEYPVGLVAAAALLPWSRTLASRPRVADLLWAGAVGGVGYGVARVIGALGLDPQTSTLAAAPLFVWCFSLSRHRIPFALAIALLIAAGRLTESRDGVLLAERSFFGVYRVTADPGQRYHSLAHGTTLHGLQSLEPARRREPLSYYHASGPIGQTLRMVASRRPSARVAAVGLGAGTLAAHAKPGQQWTFYEIDGAVERIATDPRFFTYLTDCGPACRVVLGDARLSLAASRDRFDLIVLDAFSSDAIPMHLVTREALGVYLAHLAGDGLLAFHISNRHLDLRPILGDLAGELRLEAVAQLNHQIDAGAGQNASEWLLLGRDREAFGGIDADARWTRIHPRRDTLVWTDDYSNIVAALKRW